MLAPGTTLRYEQKLRRTWLAGMQVVAVRQWQCILSPHWGHRPAGPPNWRQHNHFWAVPLPASTGVLRLLPCHTCRLPTEYQLLLLHRGPLHLLHRRTMHPLRQTVCRYAFPVVTIETAAKSIGLVGYHSVHRDTYKITYGSLCSTLQLSTAALPANCHLVGVTS